MRKVRAYVPSHYAVCFYSSPSRPAAVLLSALPAAAADALRGKRLTESEGDVMASPDGGGPVAVQGKWGEYCSKLTTEDARAVAEGLAGIEPEPNMARLEYRMRRGAHWWQGTTIWFEPYFPDGRTTCSACG